MALVLAYTPAFHTAAQADRLFTLHNNVADSGLDGTLDIVDAIGRKWLRFSGDHADHLDQRDLTTPSGAVWIQQGKIRISAAPSGANVIFACYDGDSLQCSLDVTTDLKLAVSRDFGGSKTLLGTMTTVLSVDTVYTAGIKATIDNTTGAATVKLWDAGGTLLETLTLTGVDTQVTANASWDGLHIGAGCAGTTDHTDIIVMDGSGSALNDLLGPKRVVALFASARVSSELTEWTLSSGSSIAALLDDASPDDDTSYLEESTQDDEFSTAVDPIPFRSRAIAGAQLFAGAKLTSGSPTVKALARQDSTTYLGDNVSPGASYAYLSKPYSAMPDGTAFSGVTAATFDALQWGLALTSASTTARVTQLVVTVIQDENKGKRNLIFGYTHTFSGDDNFMVGALNTLRGAASAVGGAFGTLTGTRSWLFSLDGEEHEEEGDGRFIVHAKEIDLNADTVTVNGNPVATASVRTVGITIDGNGEVIATGVKGFVRVPFSGTITKATLLSTDASATSGSIVIDVWKDTYANYPPTNSDSITASAPPTLSAANKSEDSTLTGWATTVTAGDVLGFNVDSVSTVTRVTLILEIQES